MSVQVDIPEMTIEQDWYDREAGTMMHADVLTAIQKTTDWQPSLVEPAVLRALARRIQEISERLGLGPLEP